MKQHDMGRSAYPQTLAFMVTLLNGFKITCYELNITILATPDCENIFICVYEVTQQK